MNFADVTRLYIPEGRVKIIQCAGVTLWTAPPIVITKQPVNVATFENITVKFSVRAEGEGLTYQWEYNTDGTWKNNSNASATSAELTFTAKDYHNGYKYRCLITDAAGNMLRTKEVLLNVNDVGAVDMIVITQQPADVTVPENATATFHAAAEGIGLKYQWEYSTNGGSGWANNTLGGNATDTLSFAAKSYHDGYLYRCRIYDEYGNTVRTSVATLRISNENGGTVYTEAAQVISP